MNQKGMMKAARLHEIEKPFKIEEISIPKIGPSDVLVKVKATGINGGDLHLFHGEIMPGKFPLVMFHEIGGIIEEVGDEVRNLKKGARVVIDPTLSCGAADCVYCYSGKNHFCEHVGFMGMRHLGNTAFGQELFLQYADAGLAEYVKAPAKNIVPLSHDISFEEASKLPTVAVTLEAARKARINPGDTVIINAATGATGVCAVKCAQLFGPSKIIAIARSRERLERLKAMAPDTIEVISTFEDNVGAKIRELTGGKGGDSLIDIVPTGGAKSTQEAISSLRKGGRAVLIGGTTENIVLSYRLFMGGGIEVTGSVAYSRQEISIADKLAHQGKLDFSGLVTHRFPLDKANEALETLDKKIGDPIWVVVMPEL